MSAYPYARREQITKVPLLDIFLSLFVISERNRVEPYSMCDLSSDREVQVFSQAATIRTFPARKSNLQSVIGAINGILTNDERSIALLESSDVTRNRPGVQP